MKGVRLKTSMELFGIGEGICFWFRLAFVDPIQIFIWLNITHKPYCIYNGFACEKEGCPYEHLIKKEDILKQFKKTEKEMRRVEVGKNGMCVYCGEEKATIEIPNPNFNEINIWKICRTCDKIIEQQQKLSLGIFLSEKKYGEKIGKGIVREASKEIKELAYESDKEVFSAIIKK